MDISRQTTTTRAPTEVTSPQGYFGEDKIRAKGVTANTKNNNQKSQSNSFLFEGKFPSKDGAAPDSGSVNDLTALAKSNI